MAQPQYMVAMAGMGGPVGGPVGQPMNAAAMPANPAYTPESLVKKLNTAIYDYLLCNEKYEIARAFMKALPIETSDQVKQSPNQRQNQTNGIVDDPMDVEGKNHIGIQKRPDDLPAPNSFQSESAPFLQDWWCQFWEIYHGNRHKGKQTTLSYIGTQRQAQKARAGIMGGMDPNAMRNMSAYGNMMNNNIELKKRAAMQNM